MFVSIIFTRHQSPDELCWRIHVCAKMIYLLFSFRPMQLFHRFIFSNISPHSNSTQSASKNTLLTGHIQQFLGIFQLFRACFVLITNSGLSFYNIYASLQDFADSEHNRLELGNVKLVSRKRYIKSVIVVSFPRDPT